MRTRSLGSPTTLLALILAACGQSPLHAPAPVATTSAPAPPTTPTVSIDDVTVPVARDDTLIDRRGGSTQQVIHRQGSVVALIEDWASRPQSLGRCGAGHERWLRVIDIVARRELFSRPVESCLNDVAPDDPVATWNESRRRVEVNLLSAPSYAVGLDGTLIGR